MKPTLAVAIATYNEAENLEGCLHSVSTWVDEIVVVDGGSSDGTVAIAKSFNTKIIQTDNPIIFHINKQKALEGCRSTWILQLDADERVTKELKEEILYVITHTDAEIEERPIDERKKKLFDRHEQLLEQRDGKIGDTHGDIVAFFVPRRNFFLGHAMTYAGMYPDGVIRLVRNGKARFPAQSVHEQIAVNGRVAWLYQDLIHLSNPTLARYLRGADVYTNTLARELRQQALQKDPLAIFSYCIIKPWGTFISLFILHKGFLDGVYGFLFAFFSALHYPVAFLKLISSRV